METKNFFKIALFISITATMVSCGKFGNKQTNSSNEDSTAKVMLVRPTTLDTAECFITRFLNENKYYVPSAWLFETGIKQMIDGIPNLVGIKFYAAINSERKFNEDSLTLVMIPVIGSGPGNSKTDYLSDNYVYEFSDLCPPRCSAAPAIVVVPTQKDSSFIVPRSWYFGKKKIQSLMKNSNGEFAVRLYQYIHEGTLDLKMVPVVYVNDTTFNDIIKGNYISADEICLGGNYCDASSRLYNATKCPE